MLIRRKKKLFGNHIEANCDYCCHNSGSEEELICSFHLEPDRDGSCRRFSYDPLMRTPRALPPMREYEEDDFKL